MSTRLQRERAAARAWLANFLSSPDPPLPDDERIVEWLPDRRVRVRWNRGILLTWSEILILSYHRDNQLFLDVEGRCFGFEGDDLDYLDFCDESFLRGEMNSL